MTAEEILAALKAVVPPATTRTLDWKIEQTIMRSNSPAIVLLKTTGAVAALFLIGLGIFLFTSSRNCQPPVREMIVKPESEQLFREFFMPAVPKQEKWFKEATAKVTVLIYDKTKGGYRQHY
ncbi:hypothetical protein P0136_10165 [Lentisphaerota bacterium ZTH]|nr:hypothetical protein JYG24_12325 [Lentisphaerota bacterium]WET05725.1 hypothetical protein P0136_10165 [Lentisphaerota bacterium ZTH]